MYHIWYIRGFQRFLDMFCELFRVTIYVYDILSCWVHEWKMTLCIFLFSYLYRFRELFRFLTFTFNSEYFKFRFTWKKLLQIPLKPAQSFLSFSFRQCQCTTSWFSKSPWRIRFNAIFNAIARWMRNTIFRQRKFRG